MDVKVNANTGQIAVRDDATGKYVTYEKGEYKFSPQLNEFAIPQADGKFMRIPAPGSAAREGNQQQVQPQSLPEKASANNRSLPRPGQAAEEALAPVIGGGVIDPRLYTGDRARLDAPGQSVDDILAQNTLQQARNSFPFANQISGLVDRFNQSGTVGRTINDNTAQSLLLNGGDELAGGAAYAANLVGLGNEGETAGQAYDRRAGEIRNRIEVESEANSDAALAGQLTGLGLSIALPGNGLLSLPKTGLGKIAAGGLFGGGIGALSGFNSGENPEERLNEALIGGTLGAGLGTIAPILIGLAGRGISKASDIVGKLLNRGASPVQNLADDAARNLPLTNKIDDLLAPEIKAGTKADYNAGIKEIAKNVSRDRTPIANVRAALDQLGEGATIADASGQNTLSLLQSVASQPGAGKQITSNFLDARQTTQRSRIIDRAKSLLNASGKSALETTDEIVAAQQKAATPLYKEAFDNAQLVDTKSIIDDLNSRLETAKGGIKTALEKARGLLLDRSGRPEIELKALHETKIALDDAIDAASKDSSVGKVARRELIKVQEQLLSAIDEVNPRYAEARKTFAGYERSKEAIDLGRSIFKGDAGVNAKEIAALSDAEKELVREGAFDAIQESINSIPRGADVAKRLNDIETKIQRLRPVFPSDDLFNEFRGTLEAEGRKFATKTKVLAGSQTQERLASQSDLSGLLSSIDSGKGAAGGDITSLVRIAGKGLDYATDAGSQAVTEGARGEIAKALLSSAPEVRDRILRDIEKALLNGQLSRFGQDGLIQATPRAGATFLNERR